MKIMLVMFATLWIVLTGAAFCAELQPFELPSQKEGNAPSQAPPPPNPREPRVDESVYENFTKKAKNLDDKIRRELLKSFGKKRDDAIKEEDWEKAEHYARLLKILKR